MQETVRVVEKSSDAKREIFLYNISVLASIIAPVRERGRKENTVPAKVEITGEIARIILSGDLDFSSQANLGDAIDQALSMALTKEIHIDMANTTFIDSSVIRALLKLREAAIAQDKPMSIWNCNEQIREIFVIGGFDQIFVIY